MNTGFEGLDESLGTTYSSKQALDDAEVNAKHFQDLKEGIARKTAEKRVTLEDKEYMEFELKTLIENSRRVMDVLENDLKIGAQPRAFEVYATLTKSVLDGIRELRELHTSIEHLKLAQDKLDFKKTNVNNMLPGGSVTLKLTGSDLFKMMKDAQKNSQLNNIDADFEIVESKSPEAQDNKS